MGAIRRNREERPRAGLYRLTERDLRILHAVGRMKFARTSQLALLFFGDLSTCTRRLAKLVALGHLAAYAPHPNEENLYGLHPRGRDVLVESGVNPADLHLGRRPTRPDLGHLLAINDVRVAL